MFLRKFQVVTMLPKNTLRGSHFQKTNANIIRFYKWFTREQNEQMYGINNFFQSLICQKNKTPKLLSLLS